MVVFCRGPPEREMVLCFCSFLLWQDVFWRSVFMGLNERRPDWQSRVLEGLKRTDRRYDAQVSRHEINRAVRAVQESRPISRGDRRPS